jgi:outer membrane protein TolC
MENSVASILIPTSRLIARYAQARASSSGLRALVMASGLLASIPAVGTSQQPGARPPARVIAPADTWPDPDTTFAVGPRLSLETIIAQTLANSPAVAGAVGAVRDATAARRVAIGAYLPSLVLNGITGKSDQSLTNTNTGTPAGVVNTTRGIGASALLDVFTGGRRGAVRRQADAFGRAADAGLVLQRYATIFVATQGYLDVRRAHELIRVAADQLAQARLGLDYVLRRQAAGTAMLADVFSAELAVSTARQAQLAAVDTLGMSTAALGRLVGANGSVDAEPGATLEPIPLVVSDANLIALAETSAPAVLATQAQASADTAAVRAAKTLYIPTITAGAGYNKATTTSFVGALRPGWILELTTSFPLFDGFVRESTITQAEVASDVATVTAADTRRFSRATAQQLLGNLHVAEHSIELARESVRLATENLRVFRARYNAGISTILDILTAQTLLVQAELSLVSARYTYQSTRASLEALLGRRL